MTNLLDTFIDLSTTGICHLKIPKEFNFQQPPTLRTTDIAVPVSFFININVSRTQLATFAAVPTVIPVA